MKNLETYFPERYADKRHFSKKMLKVFQSSDFDPDYNSRENNEIHELREYIRQPVNEWQEGSYLPDEVLDERDDILSRLHKDGYELPENPTKEDYSKWNEYQSKIMKSDVWKEWSEWLSKTKDMIIVHRKLEQETVIARDFIRFNQSGRNIFEISPFLRQLLENTEVGNIRFKDFALPYKTVYFHFGTLDGFEYPVDCYEEKFNAYLAKEFDFETDEEEDEFYINKKYLLEGAFVSITRENCIDIQLCFKDPIDNFSKNINIVDDHRFPSFEFTLSFGQWDREESKTKYSDETTFNQSTVVFCDIWDEEATIGEIDYEKLNRLTSEPENCNDFEWKEYVLMDKALKLIVNCICYLNTNDKDVNVSSTNQQATELIQELERTKKTQARNKLIQKLSKFSYSKIHLLGQGLRKYFDSQETGIELEPHWRRGHWRNQPFGKSLSETKLIWIKPTIVRKDKGEPKKGHVYEL
jgi:hypothetical protein